MRTLKKYWWAIALVPLGALLAAWYNTDTNFIRRVYRENFIREPQASEIDAWLTNLAGGGSRALIVQALRTEPAGVALRQNPVALAGAKRILPIFWPWYSATSG